MSANYMQLQAEILQLKKIIAQLDEGAVIEKLGYEHRLEELESRLQEMPASEPTKSFDLTFRGDPVVGSQAIKASFVCKAADLFSDAYDVVVAALSGVLGDATSGPVPDKKKYELLISGTAVGSFGFQFQLPDIEIDLLQEEPVSEQAIKKIEQIFKVATSENDEEIADAIEMIPPRAVNKIYSFLDQLEKNKAWCGLSFGRHKFQFDNFSQLQKAANKLKEDNIIEKKQSFEGVITGFLPASKDFEFKINSSSNNEVIKGKVSPNFSNPDELNTVWLNKPSKITCNQVTVGSGRPRYTLLKIDA